MNEQLERRSYICNVFYSALMIASFFFGIFGNEIMYFLAYPLTNNYKLKIGSYAIVGIAEFIETFPMYMSAYLQLIAVVEITYAIIYFIGMPETFIGILGPDGGRAILVSYTNVAYSLPGLFIMGIIIFVVIDTIALRFWRKKKLIIPRD